MLAEAFLWLTRSSPSVRRGLFRTLFQTIARVTDRAEFWSFMNYGYVDAEMPVWASRLTGREFEQRYACYLYHRVASAVDLTGKDVLEVGSGRGGGAAYIAGHLGPRRMVGIDISPAQTTLSNRIHPLPNLEFRPGDAENIPFPDGTFDAVVNVESSFCYGSFDRFLSEVKRVLKPGGHFLYTDLRLAPEMGDWTAALERSGLEMVERHDISAAVVQALREDSDRRAAASQGHVPDWLQKPFQVFMGVEGTRIPNLLSNGEMHYHRFVFRKPA